MKIGTGMRLWIENRWGLRLRLGSGIGNGNWDGGGNWNLNRGLCMLLLLNCKFCIGVGRPGSELN